MDAQERVARILCRLMGDEWQQGERLYRNTADEIIATLSPASNVAPREAGIQAFYADEGTTNTLQGLNAAFDAYEAADIMQDPAAAGANGGPAFAALATSPMGDVHHQEGMSLRDWFAGQALPTIIALIGIPEDGPDDLWNSAMAAQAYGLSDAMLAARSKAKEA